MENKIDNAYHPIPGYKTMAEIGKGQFSIVYKAMNLKTKQIVAIKKIDREELIKNDNYVTLLNNEVSIMSQIRNRNVVKFEDYFETSTNCFLVLEYCNDGTLEKFMKLRNKPLDENEALDIFEQLLNGFKSDLALKNILIKKKVIKIADLGFAKQVQSLTGSMLGTPYYMAPEIHNNKKYNNLVDLWSLGVVYYHLLYNKIPFFAMSMNDLKDLINNGINDNLLFNNSDVKISDESKDLLKRIFKSNPNERITWKEVYNHPLLPKLKKKTYDDYRKIEVTRAVKNYFETKKFMKMSEKKKEEYRNKSLEIQKKTKKRQIKEKFENKISLAKFLKSEEKKKSKSLKK